nr:hypothetical protein [Bradyrhizobium sp. AUGA SZCCT0222]
MFDVYLNHKRDLLVVRQGSSMPLGDTSGKWQKRKRRVANVSDEIKSTVQRQGYYMRKRSELKTN